MLYDNGIIRPMAVNVNRSLYDFKKYVKQDCDAIRLAKEATARLKELYFANPEPLDQIASYYLKIFLKKLSEGQDITLSTYTGYTQVKQAYPNFEFSELMFMTTTERQEFLKKSESTDILKCHNIRGLMEFGNTIISKSCDVEELKKEAKRRLNLDIVVQDFRAYSDPYFWLVETRELNLIKSSKDIQIK